MNRRVEIGDCVLYQGDCLEIMPTLGKVDAVVTDPPYGTTSNAWDAVVDFDDLWRGIDAVTSRTAAIVMTSSQPFTSALVMSRPAGFRHEWIWQKNRGSNFANTVREPMKEHESVLMFSQGQWVYNAQMQERTGGGADRVKYDFAFNSKSENYREFEGRDGVSLPSLRQPSSIQKFNTAAGKEKTIHPTQKPVALFEYLIKTYSDEGNAILDPFMGSGTTLVACAKLGRKGIGIELDPEYFDIACRRVEEAYRQPDLFIEPPAKPEQTGMDI